MEFKTDSDRLDGVAIIGMAGRYPGAKNIDKFWENICNGIESIKFYSKDELESAGISKELINDSNYVRAKGELEDIELFDANFFGFTPREAELMDPQHRLLLECAWEALENAGYDTERYDGRVGVYAGESMSTYLLLNVLQGFDKMVASAASLQAAIGNDKDSLTTTISYRMNLKGPGITIQSSSSTSLVAVNIACQSLLNYQCDMALAGGISVGSPQKNGYMYEEAGIVSPDGHCRPFDSKAKGFVPGTGMGLVVLKRLSEALEDGDNIYAIIRGYAINNDGSQKVSYSAPSVDAQAEVIAEAQALAGFNPDTISYVEAHGTGTEMGDPIEIAALTQAFQMKTDRKNYCAIGSVKSNIGHLDTAAGVTGLIKAALCVKNGIIPKTLHFEKPNPKIDFDNSPFYVNTTLKKWNSKGITRRAGVSSFGMGGTNAHVVIEEDNMSRKSGASREWQMLMLSAKTDLALSHATENMKNFLENNNQVNLADLSFTSQLGRREMGKRRVIICKNISEAIYSIESNDIRKVFTGDGEALQRSIVFMFTGQGSQFVNMALGLYKTEKTFKDTLDMCCEILKPYLQLDLKTILYPNESDIEKSKELLNQTWITQSSIFVIEYSMAKQLMEWGIFPNAMIGHSIGEYVAACISGVMDLKDALTLVAKRGKLMQSLPKGSMLAVAMSKEEAKKIIGDDISIAAVNEASFCTLSGPDEAIENLENILYKKGIYYSRLKTSHAFHSKMVEPILEKYLNIVSKIKLNEPTIPFISNVTGSWIKSEEAISASYWVKHLRNEVRFFEGIKELLKNKQSVFIEVGPGRTLSTLVKKHLEKESRNIVVTSLRHHDEKTNDIEHLLGCIGKLWIAGVKIDWEKFYDGEVRNRIPFPSYPFEGKRYWIDIGDKSKRKVIKKESVKIESNDDKIDIHSEGSKVYYDRPNLSTEYIEASSEIEKTIISIWEDLLGIRPIGVKDDLFELGGNSLIVTQLISRIRNVLQLSIDYTSFYEEPTVSNIVKYIINYTNEQEKSNNDIEDLLSEVENLSEEELEYYISNSLFTDVGDKQYE